MDGRDRANSTAMKGLLGRQLASITDTLAKASQRRDAELLRRSTPKTAAVPTTQLRQVPSPTNPSLTSDTEDNGSSVSGGNSVTFGGRQTKPAEHIRTFGRNFGRFDFDLAQANNITGWINAMPPWMHEPLTNELTDENLPRSFLHEGYATDDEEPAEILGRLTPIHLAARDCDDDDTREMFAHFGKSEPMVGTPNVEKELETMLRKLSNMSSSFRVGSENDESVDPAQLLAGFSTSSPTRPSTISGETEDIDPEQLLVALERSLTFKDEVRTEEHETATSTAINSPPPPPTKVESHPAFTRSSHEPLVRLTISNAIVQLPPAATSGESMALPPLSTLARSPLPLYMEHMWQTRFDQLLQGQAPSPMQTAQATVRDMHADDPRSMLAELEKETSFSNDTDPRRMLAELEQGARYDAHDGDDLEDVEVLRGRLAGLPSPLSSHISPAFVSTKEHVLSNTEIATCAENVDREVVPYVIALQLESAGLPWEEVQVWTAYLFSQGLNGYKACQEKEAVVKQATEELNKTIQQVMEKEKHYIIIENKTRLLRSLIVSNIAAGASVEDLKEFFYGHRSAIQELKLLSDRDPVKRTKVAHIDMETREAAIRASYMTGNIFGLLLNIKLAVEDEV